MKAKELRGLDREELLQKEKALKKELFQLNYERKIGTIQKPSRFSQLRRDIARILTVLREKELEDRANGKTRK